MKIRAFFGGAAGWWRALQLADRLLLVFMAILLGQSAHNLFLHELMAEDPAALDVVIRTTAAAVFGYFISAGFRDAAPSRRARQQLVIVALIGISSLLLLVLARNYAQPSAESSATLSQLRDFVSGSVGFLIGHAGSGGTEP